MSFSCQVKKAYFLPSPHCIFCVTAWLSHCSCSSAVFTLAVCFVLFAALIALLIFIFTVLLAYGKWNICLSVCDGAAPHRSLFTVYFLLISQSVRVWITAVQINLVLLMFWADNLTWTGPFAHTG